MLGNGASGRAATAQSLRRLIVPALAAMIGVAVLVSLGTWQLQRRAWKLDLIERIEARAYATPGALPPESEWAAWSPQAQEYRRVRVTGRFLYDKEAAVHGLLSGRPARPADPGLLPPDAARAPGRLGRHRQPRLRADRAARPGTPARLRSGRRGNLHGADASPGEARLVRARERPGSERLVHARRRRDRARRKALPGLRPSSSTPAPAPTPAAGRGAGRPGSRSRTTTCNTR